MSGWHQDGVRHRLLLTELEPVAERVGGVEALRAGNRLVPLDGDALAGEPRGERVEVGGDEARMGLPRRHERLLDADVQLLRPRTEPAAAAARERLGLRQLLKAEQRPVERAGLR